MFERYCTVSHCVLSFPMKRVLSILSLATLMISSISIYMLMSSSSSSSSSSKSMKVASLSSPSLISRAKQYSTSSTSTSSSSRGRFRNFEAEDSAQFDSIPHLISFETATASTRGNLGPASVILSSSTKDWLNDRWQAAKDMSGKPIPGPHFVLLSTSPNNGFSAISRIVIDWETASASDIRISAVLSDSMSTLIYKRGDKRERSKSNKHIIDSIPINFKSQNIGQIEKIRIDILSPETVWGSSIWHVEVFGF